MTGLLTAASAGITLAGGFVYLLHARREARPQVVSWVIWTVLAVILAASSLITGQVPAAVYVAADGAMGAAALVVVIRRGDWTLEPLDWVCGAGAAASLVLLAAAQSPSAATIAAVTADAFACGPTVTHAWEKPREEPWLAFAGWTAGGALALAAALAGRHHGITAVVSPAYLLVANGAVAAVILARRPWKALAGDRRSKVPASLTFPAASSTAAPSPSGCWQSRSTRSQPPTATATSSLNQNRHSAA